MMLLLSPSSQKKTALPSAPKSTLLEAIVLAAQEQHRAAGLRWKVAVSSVFTSASVEQGPMPCIWAVLLMTWDSWSLVVLDQTGLTGPVLLSSATELPQANDVVYHMIVFVHVSYVIQCTWSIKSQKGQHGTPLGIWLPSHFINWVNRGRTSPAFTWMKSFNHPTWNQPDPTIASKSKCFKKFWITKLDCLHHPPWNRIFPGEHWLVWRVFGHHRAFHCPWFRDPVDDVSPHLAQELRLNVWAMTSPQGVGQKEAARFLVLNMKGQSWVYHSPTDSGVCEDW